MKYNPAEDYALAIGHLADRLRGGGPFVQSWPRDERALTHRRALRAAAIAWRAAASTSASPTACSARAPAIAIRNFQVSTGQIPDGFASSVVLDRLRQR